MKLARPIPHFDQVDRSQIRAKFFDGRKHRACLWLPFIGRQTGKTLCVIGQNPSAADEKSADKTVRYLEELVYRNRRKYGALLVLNLYSRVDTTKSADDGKLLHPRCLMIFDDALKDHDDFLLVYGKLKNQRAYKFSDRAAAVAEALKSKNVFKIDIGTPYPPHPGNKAILYQKLDVKLARYKP